MFLYLRPDVFVIFDRVRSPDASFRKVWVVHTVDEPTVGDPATGQAQGMRAYTDAGRITVTNARNVTTVDALLPEANRVVVRGGDTVLATGLVLSAGSAIGAGQVTPSDNARWLEVFAVGADVEKCGRRPLRTERANQLDPAEPESDTQQSGDLSAWNLLSFNPLHPQHATATIYPPNGRRRPSRHTRCTAPDASWTTY